MVLKRMALPLDAESEPVSACGYMNERHRRTDRERDVRTDLRRLQRQPRREGGVRRDLRVERLSGRLKNRSEPAELVGNDHNGRDDEV